METTRKKNDAIPSLADEADGRPRERKPGCVLKRMLLAALLASFASATLLVQLHHTTTCSVSDGGAPTTLHAGRTHANFSAPGRATAAQSSPGGELLDGLLTARIDSKSCLSMHQHALYRKKSKHKPSFYLQQKLRKYESLHKRCAPYTKLYNKSINQLLNHNPSTEAVECKYVILKPISGLGNRMLSLTSAFLYALLTNRVLLLSPDSGMEDLFCEPFPEGTWLLPKNFPSLNHFFNKRYGNMVVKKIINRDENATSIDHPLPYVYVHLAHDYSKEDQLFFCQHDQFLLQKFPWMMMLTDNYFTPSLFLIPTFMEELDQLFPEKDTIFHHLGRYLFHPNNSVWGLITRYYRAYLSKQDERIGLQIRFFRERREKFWHALLNQAFSCMVKERLVSKVDFHKHVTSTSIGKSKAILLTSLSSWYFEKFKNMYWEHPVANGEDISVYQPSHEEHQQSHNHSHNMKALAEIYLLSLTDALVTTAQSTFGYIAQGLGGMEPLILSKTKNNVDHEFPCHRGVSIEPCFHSPPNYDCKGQMIMDIGEHVPHVKHCEDRRTGIKLVG